MGGQRIPGDGHLQARVPMPVFTGVAEIARQRGVNRSEVVREVLERGLSAMAPHPVDEATETVRQALLEREKMIEEMRTIRRVLRGVR